MECGGQESLDCSSHLHARQSRWRVPPTRVRRLSPLWLDCMAARSPHHMSLYTQILWDSCRWLKQWHSASLTLSGDSAQNPSMSVMGFNANNPITLIEGF